MKDIYIKILFLKDNKTINFFMDTYVINLLQVFFFELGKENTSINF
jgi:hypothetical protein